jgi:hypothetical protein
MDERSYVKYYAGYDTALGAAVFFGPSLLSNCIISIDARWPRDRVPGKT